MKEKSPAFQWYPSDFLSDPRAASLSTSEVGAYFLLLNYCWIEGEIPDDDQQLARLTRLRVDHWRRMRSSVLVLFIYTGGYFRHKRLDEEREKQLKWIEKSRLGGKASAEKRKGGSRVVEPPYQPKGNTPSPSSSPESECIITPPTPPTEGRRPDAPRRGRGNRILLSPHGETMHQLFTTIGPEIDADDQTCMKRIFQIILYDQSRPVQEKRLQQLVNYDTQQVVQAAYEFHDLDLNKIEFPWTYFLEMVKNDAGKHQRDMQKKEIRDEKEQQRRRKNEQGARANPGDDPSGMQIGGSIFRVMSKVRRPPSDEK